MADLKEGSHKNRNLNPKDLVRISSWPCEHLSKEKRVCVFSERQNGRDGLEKRNNRNLEGGHDPSVPNTGPKKYMLQAETYPEVRSPGRSSGPGSLPKLCSGIPRTETLPLELNKMSPLQR